VDRLVISDVNSPEVTSAEDRVVGLVKDDGYNPIQTAKNVTEMVDGADRKVFGLAGVIGTGPSLAALEIITKKKVLFFGPASGFDLLEPDPPNRYVFNIRPRYSDEAVQLTQYMLATLNPAVPPQNIAVFGQGEDDKGKLDAFGFSAFAGVAGTLKVAGVPEKDLLAVSYPASATADVANAVKTLLEWAASSKRVTAPTTGRIRVGVVMATLAEAAVPLIKELEEQLAAVRLGNAPAAKYGTFTQGELDALAKVDLQLASLSTVDVRLADALKSLGTYKSKDAADQDVDLGYGAGLIMALPMPPFDSSATGVVQYQQHMQTHQPNSPLGFISLEAYFTARMLIEGLKQAGRDLTTESLIDTLENGMDGNGLEVDFGIGTVFKFGKSSHQASEKLWGMRITPEISFESIGVLVQ
jgi:branched-chain amino acid transport system substrate-binding protein